MMLSPTERVALHAQWLAEIDAEIERRRDAAMTTDSGDPRAVLLAQLAVMGERLRADPNFVEPGEAEDRLLERWFKQRGYDIKLGG
jgi:hypothetical protein